MTSSASGGKAREMRDNDGVVMRKKGMRWWRGNTVSSVAITLMHSLRGEMSLEGERKKKKGSR